MDRGILRLEGRSKVREGLSELYKKEHLAVRDRRRNEESFEKEIIDIKSKNRRETYLCLNTDENSLIRICKNYLKHTIYYGKSENLTR